MTLRGILDHADGRRLTLTLYDSTLRNASRRAIESYFEPQCVQIRSGTSDPGGPADFAVLHDGDRFLAASRLRDVHRYLDPGHRLGTADGRGPPDVLARLRDRTFSRFDRRRMVMASREVERRAWSVGAGVIHAGFQKFSRITDQRPVYERLVEAGLEVHVYGHPDATVGLDVVDHGHATPELADAWFVIFDGDGNDEDACVLLAEEVHEGVFNGMWTDRAPVVRAIVEYLDGAYPPTRDSVPGPVA